MTNPKIAAVQPLPRAALLSCGLRYARVTDKGTGAKADRIAMLPDCCNWMHSNECRYIKLRSDLPLLVNPPNLAAPRVRMVSDA